MWTRPDAKRKLLLAFVFVFSCALSIANIGEQPKSISAWGTLFGLTIMGISGWPFVKEFIWPSGLDHIAATELSLSCHGWKNVYIFTICPELGKKLDQYAGDDIWDKILAGSHHEDTADNWERFQPLFVEEAVQTQRRIDQVLSRYSDVLPSELRVLAHHAMTQLSLAGFSYALSRQNPSEQALYGQFLQVIKALSNLDHPAHELQPKTKT